MTSIPKQQHEKGAEQLRLRAAASHCIKGTWGTLYEVSSALNAALHFGQQDSGLLHKRPGTPQPVNAQVKGRL